jgi:tight adherence protein B
VGPFILIAILGGAGVLAYLVYRNATAKGPVAISARLGRYGLAGAGSGGASKVIAPSGGQSAAAAAVTQRVGRALGQGKRYQKLQNKLDQADWKMTPPEFATINLATLVGGAAVGLLIHGFIGLLILGVVGGVGPTLFLNKRVKKRKKKFIEQLADLSQMMGNSMRAGFSIIQSMELVANEASEPAATEFERVVTEVKLGLTIESALQHLLDRMPSEDLELMVIAINVQRVVGGNLAEILMTISNTIRERIRFERDLQALTAQAKYSSYIITGLPIAVAIAINLLDPTYEKMLYTTLLGYLMIGLSLTMLSIGFFILNKISTIEV